MMILCLLQLLALPSHLLLACQQGLVLGSGLHQLLQKLQLLHHQFLKLQQVHQNLPWTDLRLLAAVSLLLIQLTLAAAAAVAAAAVVVARLRLRLTLAAAAVAAAAVAVARLRLRLTLAAAKAAVVVARLISRRSSQANSWVAPSAGAFRMAAAIAAGNLAGNKLAANIGSSTLTLTRNWRVG